VDTKARGCHPAANPRSKLQVSAPLSPGKVENRKLCPGSAPGLMWLYSLGGFRTLAACSKSLAMPTSLYSSQGLATI
jgi:hypothetical protein